MMLYLVITCRVSNATFKLSGTLFTTQQGHAHNMSYAYVAILSYILSFSHLSL